MRSPQDRTYHARRLGALRFQWETETKKLSLQLAVHIGAGPPCDVIVLFKRVSLAILVVPILRSLCTVSVPGLQGCQDFRL